MSDHWYAYASTIIRGTDSRLSGYLLLIDWSRRKILKKVPIPDSSGHRYWNARGGNRGGRGIALDPKSDLIFVATATAVLKYTTELEYVGALNHEYMAGLHEIMVENDSIWLISAIHDLAYKLGINGDIQDVWWGSESFIACETFSHAKRKLNMQLNFTKSQFEHEYDQYSKEEIFHLNAIARQDDSIYLLASHKNAVLKIRPTEELVFCDNDLAYPHNLVLTDDGHVVMNDTGNQRLRVYDLCDGSLLKSIPTYSFAKPESSVQFAKAGWQRGLSSLGCSRYLVGTSPAQLFEIDLESGRQIGSRLFIDSDVKHCIHGLLAVQK